MSKLIRPPEPTDEKDRLNETELSFPRVSSGGEFAELAPSLDTDKLVLIVSIACFLAVLAMGLRGWL